MAYTTMKKLIVNANTRYEQGSMTKEEYGAYREATQRKLDVFYANGMLTDAQYEELTGMWLETNDDKAS